MEMSSRIVFDALVLEKQIKDINSIAHLIETCLGFK